MKRFLRAFLVAPLAAPVLYWAWNLVAAAASGPDRRRAVLQDPLRELAVILAFGAPIAYGAALVAVLLGFRLLRLRSRLAPVWIGLMGAATGVATSILLHPLFGGGDLFRVVLTPVQGAVLGGVSAVLFRWLWTRGNPPSGKGACRPPSGIVI